MKAPAILMWLFFSTVDLKEQTSNDTATLLTDDSCPPWQVRNKTGICKCVIGDIHGIVMCRDEPYSLQLFQCFCMTYYTETNQSLVGSCQYTCDRHMNGHFFDITVGSSLKLNEMMCSKYKRQGQLCGSCIAGFLHQSTPTLSHVLTVLLATGPSTQQSPFCQSLHSFSLPSHSDSVLPLQNSVDILSVYKCYLYLLI